MISGLGSPLSKKIEKEKLSGHCLKKNEKTDHRREGGGEKQPDRSSHQPASEGALPRG